MRKALVIFILLLLVSGLLAASSLNSADRSRLTIYLLDVSSSMVGKCSSPPGCEDRESYLQQAVDNLYKTLGVRASGTIILMLFGQTLHDMDQHPQEHSDGPIRDIYTLELGEGQFHSAEDLEQLLRFIAGGAFVYRALPGDMNREGDGEAVEDWPGIVEAVRASAERSYDGTDFRKQAFFEGPYWHGRCTALFGSIRDAIDYANGLGDFERVDLYVLTDGTPTDCDYGSPAEVGAAIERLGGEIGRKPEFFIQWYYWGERIPETVTGDVDPGKVTVVGEEVSRMDKPHYLLYFDRGTYRFDPEISNAWFDTRLTIADAKLPHVHLVNEKGECDPAASLPGVIELELSGEEMHGISFAEGTEILVGPFESAYTYSLVFDLSPEKVRETARGKGPISGWLDGWVEFSFRGEGDVSESEVVKPPGLPLEIPFAIPDLTVKHTASEGSLRIDLTGDSWFYDPRNTSQVQILGYEDHFRLEVDGSETADSTLTVKEHKVLRLIPREKLVAGIYEGEVIIRLTSGDAVINGSEGPYVVPYQLNVVRLGKSSLSFPKLWEEWCFAGEPETLMVSEELPVRGIAWSELVVEPSGFEIPNVGVDSRLVPSASVPNSCEVKLLFTSAENLAGSKDNINAADPDGWLKFSVDLTTELPRLVVFKEGREKLPVSLEYREKIIIAEEVIQKAPDSKNCTVIPPEEIVLEISLLASEDLDESSHENEVYLREERSTLTEEAHLYLRSPETMDPIESGIPVAIEEMKTAVTLVAPQEDGRGTCDTAGEAYEGTLTIEPRAEDVWLRDQAGELHKKLEFSYNFGLPPKCDNIRIPVQTINFTTPTVENPHTLEAQLQLVGGEHVPKRGEIEVRVVEAHLAERAGVSLRRDWFHITPVRPPFSGGKTITLEIDQNVLDRAKRYDARTILGVLELTYRSPSDANGCEASALLESDGRTVRSLEFDFTALLSGGVSIDIVPDIASEGCVEAHGGGVLCTITAQHDPELGQHQVEAIMPSGFVLDLVREEGLEKEWKLSLSPDCQAAPLGTIDGIVALSVPGLPDTTIYINGKETPDDSYRFCVSRRGELTTTFLEEEPPRTCGEENEIAVWRRGDVIARLSTAAGRDAECLTDERLLVIYDGTTDDNVDPYVRLVSDSGNGLPAEVNTWAVKLCDDAPLGTKATGSVRIESSDESRLVIMGPNGLTFPYQIHVLWPLMEILKGVATRLLWVALAPFAAGLLFVLVKSAIEGFRGNPPWVVIIDFYMDAKRGWARRGSVVLIIVSVVALIGVNVLSRWTC